MKKIFIVLLSLVLVFSSAVFVFAERNEDLSLVADNAGIFTEEEKEVLEALCGSLYESSSYDVLILTEPDNHGFSEDYGYIDYFWETSGYGSDEEASGICLYICMDPNGRFWYTEATGKACDYINYDVVNIVDDCMTYYMRSGQLAYAAQVWIEEYAEVFKLGPKEYVSKYYQEQNPDYPPYEKDPEEVAKENLKSSLTAGGIIGLIAGIINLSIGYSGMKTVRVASDANRYKIRGSMHLVRSKDILTNVSVRAVPLNNDNNSGGGGHSGGSSFSSHSSGGFSHSGGGGRGF